MTKYIEEYIKEVAATNIVEIISRYLQLQKHGSDFVSVCPFHSDHKPSLHVSQSKKVWKCFACGEGGDTIDFLMKFLGIGYVEALQVVADIYVINAQDKPYNPTKQVAPITTQKPTLSQEIGFIPIPFVLKSMKYKGQLWDYLFKYVGTADLAEVWDRYCVGATKDGKEIFWYLTAQKDECDVRFVRYAKVMDYNTDGHRKHDKGAIYALHPTVIQYMKKRKHWAVDYEPIFKPSLFGSHLINAYPDRTVAIVESEKTALICACFISSLTWCAVGGLGNLNNNILEPCKGHSVLLFPDIDAIDKWKDRAVELQCAGYDVQVKEWWQSFEGIGDKDDIADVLMRDAQPIAKFTEEEWSALDFIDEPQQPKNAQALLDEMCKRNSAIAMLVKKLNLELVA